jgi:hypothetical protein
MRTREKILVLLVGISVALGTFIFIQFQTNEVEADYFRWLIANYVKFGTSSPMRFIIEEITPGRLLYGGVSLFALVCLFVVLKMLRDGELLVLRARLREMLAAKSEAESQLQEEVWRGKHERQAKDHVTRDLESSIERIERLIGDLNEKEKLLSTRDAEIMALKSRTADHHAVDPSWNFPSPSLRAEFNQQAETLRRADAAIKELERG